MADFKSRHTIGQTGKPATLIGFGGAPLGQMFTPIDDAEVDVFLEQLWQAGVRVFDTAPFYGYGLSERRLGDFLRTKPRDEYLLSTKVGRMLVPRRDEAPTDSFFLSILPFNPVFDYSYDGAMRSFEDSLQRMGLDRIDIVLIHDTGVAEHGERQPAVFEEALEGAAKAMFKLRDEKAVGAVGMGTNEWEVAEAALRRADFDTMLLAGRYTLLEQHSAQTLLPLCVERNAHIILGGVFNSGLLVSDEPADSTWNYQKPPQELVDRTLQLKTICDRHDVPLPAAALHFAMAHPAVATALVGIRSTKEASEMVEWANMTLPQGLWTDFKDEGMIPVDSPVPE